eukprot:6161668-Pleurochrysis_carterae.AAC.1
MVIANAIASRITVATSVTTEPNNAESTVPPTVENRSVNPVIPRVTTQPADEASTTPADESAERDEAEPPDLERHFRRGLGA